MSEMKKQMYQSPCITVIKVENEGVMASSSGSIIDGGNPLSGNPLNSTGGANSSTPTSSYSNSTSDLEDLINEILTIGQ